MVSMQPSLTDEAVLSPGFLRPNSVNSTTADKGIEETAYRASKDYFHQQPDGTTSLTSTEDSSLFKWEYYRSCVLSGLGCLQNG